MATEFIRPTDVITQLTIGDDDVEVVANDILAVVIPAGTTALLGYVDAFGEPQRITVFAGWTRRFFVHGILGSTHATHASTASLVVQLQNFG